MLWSNSTEEDWNTVGDACPVYDRHTGKTYVIFTRNNREYWVTHSQDLGESWSMPKNITATVEPKKKGAISGTGHAGGIQLSSGRLLIPAYSGGSFSIVSDDHGQSWYAGEHAYITGADGQNTTAGGECQAVELSDHRLILNMRNDGSVLAAISC